MLVLFVCLAVAVVIQGLCAVVLCAEGAGLDEAVGRKRLEEKDQALAALREKALSCWEVVPWTVLPNVPGSVEGSLVELEEGSEWVLGASVRQDPSVSRLSTSAWVERGRDGIDLPLAALVAGAVEAGPDRLVPWIELDAGGDTDGGSAEGSARDAGSPAPEAAETEAVTAYALKAPADPLLGEGCSLVGLSETWRLDPGWLALEPTGDPESGETSGSLAAVAPSGQVLIINGRPAHTLRPPEGGSPADSPVLVIAKGGADLDACNWGDFYGVLVVDDGSLLLDGTTVHGAVFVSDTVYLGETGRILFSRSTLRWATDRSLNRARLVPGSRWEGTE